MALPGHLSPICAVRFGSYIQTWKIVVYVAVFVDFCFIFKYDIFIFLLEAEIGINEGIFFKGIYNFLVRHMLLHVAEGNCGEKRGRSELN